MPAETRYCLECQAVTTHIVVSGKDVMARLCQECLWHWATQLEAKETHVRGKLAQKESLDASLECRTETEDRLL